MILNIEENKRRIKTQIPIKKRKLSYSLIPVIFFKFNKNIFFSEISGLLSNAKKGNIDAAPNESIIPINKVRRTTINPLFLSFGESKKYNFL